MCICRVGRRFLVLKFSISTFQQILETLHTENVSFPRLGLEPTNVKINSQFLNLRICYLIMLIFLDIILQPYKSGKSSPHSNVILGVVKTFNYRSILVTLIKKLFIGSLFFQ